MLKGRQFPVAVFDLCFKMHVDLGTSELPCPGREPVTAESKTPRIETQLFLFQLRAHRACSLVPRRMDTPILGCFLKLETRVIERLQTSSGRKKKKIDNILIDAQGALLDAASVRRDPSMCASA
jgi:hypothetical protein